MPSVERTVETDRSIEQVWAYLSDFRTTQEWDPPTVSTTRTSGDGSVGTTYHNVSRFLGHETEVTYEVTAFEPHQRLQLRGDAGDSLDLLDTITLDATSSGGTRVTYHAEFTPSGAAKLAAPLMPLALKVLADKVAASLEERLRSL